MNEDIMNELLNSKHLYVCYGDAEDGTFFICNDWMAPEDKKMWYKFSTCPWDIDFLEFVPLEKGFYKKKQTPHALMILLKYFNIRSRNCLLDARAIDSVFFKGGYVTTALDKFNKKNNEKVSTTRLYMLRQKLTNAIKLFIKRLYRFYNKMDNSFYYIKDYFLQWVFLVREIQDRFDDDNIIDDIYKFIATHQINNTLGFLKAWENNILLGREKIPKLSDRMARSFYLQLISDYDNFESKRRITVK